MNILLEHGYIDGRLNGITVTSRNKKSNGKKYYAKDVLAFKAWELLGQNPDDVDFQKWKYQKDRKKQRSNSADRD